MDFKSLITKISEMDDKIPTISAPELPKTIQLNEDAALRVLAGTSTYIAEAKKKAEEKKKEKVDEVFDTDAKTGDKAKTSKGVVTKTEKGLVHKSTSAYGGSEDKTDDDDDDAPKSKKKAKKESVDPAAFKAKFTKMVEAKKEEKKIKGKKAEEKMDEGKKSGKKKPDADNDGVPDWADKKPGEDDNADKKGEKKETKGLSAKQKKLPPGLQKAIAKKKGTSESVRTSKKVVAESVEQKLTFKQMVQLVQESGGQQQIDPVDAELFNWASRVARNKLGEGMKAELYAGLIYERSGGRFEMYDVLSETRMGSYEYPEGERPKTDRVIQVLTKSGFSEEDVFGLLRFATSSGNQRDAGPNFRKMLKTLSAKGIDLFDIENA